MPPNKSARSNTAGSPLGCEANLWLAADKLRNNMDAAEYEQCVDRHPQFARRAGEARPYKHVALALIFRKDISDGLLLLA